MSSKRLIDNLLQIVGIIGSSLVLIATLILLMFFKAYKTLPLLFFMVIIITNLSALIGYIYYSRHKQASLSLIWLGLLTLILLFPYLFYANLIYLPGVILSFIAAVAGLKKADKWIWAGIVGSGLGFILSFLIIINIITSSHDFSSLRYLIIVAATQILALAGYLIGRHVLGIILVWIGVMALGAMLAITIPEGGLIIPFYFFLIIILSIKGSFTLTFESVSK